MKNVEMPATLNSFGLIFALLKASTEHVHFRVQQNRNVFQLVHVSHIVGKPNNAVRVLNRFIRYDYYRYCRAEQNYITMKSWSCMHSESKIKERNNVSSGSLFTEFILISKWFWRVSYVRFDSKYHMRLELRDNIFFLFLNKILWIMVSE